jgi:hypothetical protein
MISVYTFIQDPGRVSLFVIKDTHLGTGMPAQGSAVTNIPRSLYYQSETNPAVILLESDPGNYQIVVNGVVTGNYALSVSTTRLPEGITTAGAADGSIVEGNSLAYNLSLTSMAEGTSQTFNPIPVTFQPLRLVMEETSTPSAQAAAVDSVLQTRDPFRVVSAQNLLNQGADRNTRVLLFVSNLQLLPGETAAAVSAQAADAANNVYSLPVEDVRPVPNMASLSQLAVRLPDNLPTGTVTVRVGAHGQITNPGTIRIRD